MVQEFTTWCGMEINVGKTFLLVIDKDRKRKESMPAPDLRINRAHLKTLDINDACWYLVFWGTGNGEMSATRDDDDCFYYHSWRNNVVIAFGTLSSLKVVCVKARVARDLIKSHPLMSVLSAELFAQKGIGAFRFSAALIKWSQCELDCLQKIWV